MNKSLFNILLLGSTLILTPSLGIASLGGLDSNGGILAVQTVHNMV